MTIAVRLMRYDAAGVELGAGAWTDFTFTMEAPAVSTASIADLRLPNDTGLSDSDGLIWVPAVTGQVSLEDGATRARVELGGDGAADD